MEGKLPILLGNVQESYFRKENIRTRRKTWMKDLVYTLTRGLLSFWIERNSTLHRRDRNGLKLQESKELSEQIRYHIDQDISELGEEELEAWTRESVDIFHWSGEDQKSWVKTIDI